MAAEAPALKINQFEGPLDLLCHLIEKNELDIYDIPIVEITDQYLAYLEGLEQLDMDHASSFLVMASTLLQIKSRMLLPQKRKLDTEEGQDPREELVLKLLEYRRCKTLADELKQKHETYRYCQLRLPDPPKRIGLLSQPAPDQLSWDLFVEACHHVSRQNQLRFSDMSQRISHILKREKVSLKDKMRQIWKSLKLKSRVFFNELFPADKTSRAERVTGFLAILELLRLNRIRAFQDRPFDVILLEPDMELKTIDDDSLDAFLAEIPVEEKDYE